MRGDDFLEESVMRRAAIVLSLAFLALGCAESNQNPFIVRVSNINAGAPLLSDVIAVDVTTGLSFIPTDLTPVEFTNRQYSPSIVVDPTNFGLDFQLKGYTVTWRATEGTPAGLNLAPFNHTEAISSVVPINGTASVSAFVVSLGMKTAAPFAALAAGGQIPLIADIDFVGSPAVDPGKNIHVQATMSVVFANFADKH
jgi:hypothetical protein